MPTVIQRKTTAGPSTAMRSPFPTPGRQPEARVSALSLQGGQGAAVPSIDLNGTVAGYLAASAGGGPTINLFTGIPQMQFGSAVAGLRTPGNVGVWRTILGVLRVGDLHTGGNAQLIRGAASAGMSLTTDGQLSAYGGSGGSGRNVAVKVSSYPPRPQFVAVVFDGANSIVQVDAARATVTADNPSVAGPLIVGESTGVTGAFHFQLTEVEAHSIPLTAAELDEKRQFYRTIYQF